MTKITFQEKTWAGDFGRKYTSDIIKNPMTLRDTDKLYMQMYGATKTKLNQEFFGNLDRSMKILEVGCNRGIQLAYLQKMGFKNLYGIEANAQIVELAKAGTKYSNIIHGSALDIPFKDNYFDLVFTAGVLIHISPKNIKKAMAEIYRCSQKYISGLEYYAPKYTHIPYHGQKNLLWKADFSKLYVDSFNDVKMVKEKKLKYVTDENVDAMFLL